MLTTLKPMWRTRRALPPGAGCGPAKCAPRQPSVRLSSLLSSRRRDPWCDDGGNVDTSGSWQAGVDGASAGIAMPAHPTVGQSYRQEYRVGQAEDQARVLATDATARVPYGSFSGLVETRDFTRLEPKADEHKLYAKGVGVVLEVSLHQEDRTELVAMTR